MQSSSKYDIVILGLGPVGLLACNLLGKRGRKVLGIDRMYATYNFPRAIHIDDEIVRILQAVNLSEKILPRLKPLWGLELMDTQQRVLFRGNNKFPGGYESSNFLFLQPELEQILRAGTERYRNVDLLYEKQVTDFHQHDSSIEIFSKDGKIAEASYLIACDGANSFVRNKLGIRQKNLKFQKAALKIDAYELIQNGKVYHTVQKICSTSKPYVRMQGVGNHRRWELNYDPRLTKEEIKNPENIKKLLAELGVNVSNLKIAHVVYYYFKSVLAKEWQRGRIFLAGDAAHATPPYIGQGMCSGFRDVINLSWKLDAVLRKDLPASILSTYQTERYPHTRIQILKAVVIGYLFTTRLWYLLKLLSMIPILNKRLLHIVLPADANGKGFWGSGKASRYLFPQIRTKQNELSDNFYGNSWTLVSVGKPLDLETILLCKKAHLNFIILDEERSNLTELQKWATKYNANYFIIRPDLYVYASGKNPIELCQSFILNKENLWNSH
jgi:3-(3-hydroxy-phenyl)propionate hydroxylase